MNHRFVIITGCSGGGKSTLLAALKAKGHHVVAEPGRQIVETEADPASPRLPWNNSRAFAEAAIVMAKADLKTAQAAPGWVFFDRGLIDAQLARWRAGGPPPGPLDMRQFHRTVFLAPPWPEIYENDKARRHSFEEAVAEFEHLAQAYPKLGFKLAKLPKSTVEARVAFVLSTVSKPKRATTPKRR